MTHTDMTTNTRTCEDPGECIKCGAKGSLVVDLNWCAYYLLPDNGGEMGELFAVCRRCGYRWRVLAKDEL